ncbi:energy transducer TonB [Novosphingobium resinovorum]
MVAVKFNCSEDGVPSQVQLYKTSGHGDLDRATVRAVERIATLHPLPRGVGHDQQYIVRVLFANSEGYAQRNMTRLREDAARSNAWVGRSGATTAMLELVPRKADAARPASTVRLPMRAHGRCFRRRTGSCGSPHARPSCRWRLG